MDVPCSLNVTWQRGRQIQVLSGWFQDLSCPCAIYSLKESSRYVGCEDRHLHQRSRCLPEGLDALHSLADMYSCALTRLATRSEALGDIQSVSSPNSAESVSLPLQHLDADIGASKLSKSMTSYLHHCSYQKPKPTTAHSKPVAQAPSPVEAELSRPMKPQACLASK